MDAMTDNFIVYVTLIRSHLNVRYKNVSLHAFENLNRNIKIVFVRKMNQIIISRK